jgi:hypothetical protein
MMVPAFYFCYGGYMTEFSTTICLSPDALDSALAHDITGIALGEGFVPITEIAGYDAEELPDFTIAFGGVRALKGFGRITYDNKLSYVVAQDETGVIHDLDDVSTPTYTPVDHPTASVITLPVPKNWEDEELSAALFRGLHVQHNALVVAGAFTVAGAIGGTILGAAGGIKQGGITVEGGAILGGTLGTLGGAGAAALANPAIEAWVRYKGKQSKQYTAFELTTTR